MRRVKQYDWDKTMSGIFKEVADELNIPTGQVEEAFRVCWQHCAAKMREVIPVRLPNFGTFHLSPYKTHKIIRKMFASMHRHEKEGDPEAMTREQVVERLQKYLPLHRKASEHAPRKGLRYKAKLRREAEQKQAKEDARTSG